MKMLKWVLLSLFFAIILVSCSGGGGGDGAAEPSTPTINQSAAGIWQGASYSSTSGTAVNLIGIISENGSGRFLASNGAQYNGAVSITGDNLSSAVTGYAPLGYVFLNGTTLSLFTISGTVAQKNSINAIYTGGGDVGNITLTYDESYERPSSLALLDGTWFLSSDGISYNISIGDGIITGSTSTGCGFSGNAEIIDPAYNCYDINLVVNSCGALNGIFTGLGILSSSVTADDTLIAGVSSATSSITLSVRRQ